jgi:hypothetical protein
VSVVDPQMARELEILLDARAALRRAALELPGESYARLKVQLSFISAALSNYVHAIRDDGAEG